MTMTTPHHSEPAREAVAVPAGWKLVPVEPTRAMKDAVSRKVDDFAREHARLFVSEIWQDMLSASPAPAASGGGEAVQEALRQAIAWIEDLPRKNASHQMMDHVLDELRAALSPSTPAATGGEAVAWIANHPEGGPYLTWSGAAAKTWPNPQALYTHPAPSETGASLGVKELREAFSVAKALEACDWSGAPIGNKAIIQKAIGLLRLNGPLPSRHDCDWPEGGFSVHDSPGEHEPCYLVMPGGAMAPFNHHAGKNLAGEFVDVARARFVAAACNAALASPVPTGASVGEVNWRALNAARKVYNESLNIDAGALGATERIIKAYLAALASEGRSDG